MSTRSCDVAQGAYTRVCCDWTIRALPTLLIRLILLAILPPAAVVAGPPIELVGRGTIPGDRSDFSGLKGQLDDGTPANRVGAIGSAIAYTGKRNLYVMVPDRGPNASQFNPSVDNSTRYRSRAELFEIVVDLKAGQVKARLVGTRLFTDEHGAPLTGLSTEFVAGQSSDCRRNRRFDPEGVRVANDGDHYFVSDEYGPAIYEFEARTGKRTRAFDLPRKFAIERPAARAIDELANNTTGRQANRGLEGLAITSDGKTLVAALQSPLLQDGALAKDSRGGINVRLLAIQMSSGRTKEFLYQLSDGKKNGISEILAVNKHQFLVLERNSEANATAGFKTIFLTELRGATDISDISSLPCLEVPPGVRPVTKTPLIDLLDPEFGLAQWGLPPKIEGLTFGPDLPDGRHMLIVTSDNDFMPDEPTRLMAFAIEPAALPSFEAQRFSQ